MDHSALTYLLFVSGATHCALSCRRVAKITAIEEGEAAGWLDPERLGLGRAEGETTRLLWLTESSGGSPLPIGGSCRLAIVPPEDVLPLPALHRRLTPFSALLHSAEGSALLLEPDALGSQLPHPD